MKKYCQPEWKVTMFETDDIVTNSTTIFTYGNDVGEGTSADDTWKW